MAEHKKTLKVLLVFNAPYFTPRGYDFKQQFADPGNMYTENDVTSALLENGYQVSCLGLFDDIQPLMDEVQESPPDVIFNMVDMFRNKTQWDKNIAALIELLGIPYTGASAASLMICNNKALSKKILTFHHIKVPHFLTFYRQRSTKLLKSFRLPAIIKPLCEEASRGIAQASIVDNDEALWERVGFIHQKMNTDAIAEEYIEGRELYVSVLGAKRLRVFPPRELIFGQLPEGEPRIATYQAKWDDSYRRRWGIKSVYATKLGRELEQKVLDKVKNAFRALNLDGYARFDLRVTAPGEVFMIEANANPCLAQIDEMAQSALKVGISYPQLIRKIVEQSLGRET